jgi:hypothetical protein
MSSLSRQILILTVLFVCSLPLVTKRIYASDEVQYYAYLRSLWFDRDVSFENEYQHFYDTGVTRYEGFHETFLERTTETGRRITFATIGSALLWSPFFAVADVVVHVRRWLGDTSVAADGYAPPYIAAVAYGSAVYGWLSLVLSLLIVRRVEGVNSHRGDASGNASGNPAARGMIPLIATLAIWIGTPLFFYMYVAPPMAHACSAFVVAAFVLTWLRVRGRWSAVGLIALGALAALMVMVREQDLLIAVGPAVDLALDLLNPRREGPTRAQLALRTALGIVIFVIAYLPQLAAYQALNGYPRPSNLVARKLNWLAPHACSVLLSPEHGLIFWTPLVLLSFAGLFWLLVRVERAADQADAPAAASQPLARAKRAGGRADARRIAICLLLMVASQVYIAGSVESWTVAGAFGQRRFVGLTALFVVGLATVLARMSGSRVRQAMCAVMVVVGVWWNLGLMAQFGAGLMDRQRLELGRNTYQTFVTIPARLPELAYRYLFERRSFYKTEPPHEP